jgi:hypothetical protein
VALSHISTITGHIERYVGHIDEMRRLEGSEFDLRAGCIPRAPETDLITYVTLGVSNHVLGWPNNRNVRQELVIVVDSSHPRYEVASFLLSFGEFIARHHRGLRQGDVVGPSNPVIPNVKVNAIYATTPTIFPDEFAILKDGEVPVLFVLLIPILSQEAVFIQRESWEKFEVILESPSQDVYDLGRDALV